MALKLQIVTHEGLTFSDEVDLVVAPGIEGEMGLLTSHAPLVTTLQPGELRYTLNGEEHYLAVGAGVLEVTADSVAVLTDVALRDSEIDEAAVEKALEEAKLALDEKVTDEEIAAVNISIQKSLAQLHVKRRRRGI
ncbi:MAG: F-type H+-transporting ATPase subunit epsilon [Verrucomicrobiales bacterium]|jgi:F-type H+-transporting ATPase subunit epsilon